jgi:hypothetical protein
MPGLRAATDCTAVFNVFLSYVWKPTGKRFLYALCRDLNVKWGDGQNQ